MTDTTVATTLRERVAAYRVAGGDIPPAPEWFEMQYGLLERLAGAAVVALVGFAVAFPLILAFSVATQPLLTSASQPVSLGVKLCILLVALGAGDASGTYLGGPAADTLLGIPREVPPE